jgi:hypothetical protein
MDERLGFSARRLSRPTRSKKLSLQDLSGFGNMHARNFDEVKLFRKRKQ